MRTTLTIDDDVAARLKRLSRGRSLKKVTNHALRLGLHAMQSEQREAPYATGPRDGKPRILNLDSVAEVLAENERDHWRWNTA
ncbi:hypothetical protein [Aquisalimonas sp.]|uniref:hypothetical protein n=1 Tax=Aquisalimonas sp. TaxID=1872621 RepID=UPI0025BF11AF|nr:hypothetical protein [Aquisalimonas sp.]